MSHLERSTSLAIVRMRTELSQLLARARAEHGEGVISAAIVVLIMAIIGAAMWFAFNGIWESSRDTIQSEVESIGG